MLDDKVVHSSKLAGRLARPSAVDLGGEGFTLEVISSEIDSEDRLTIEPALLKVNRPPGTRPPRRSE